MNIDENPALESKGNVSSNVAQDVADISDKDNLDQAFHYLQNARPSAEAIIDLKTLRRKIDWRIVPIMFCAYTMQFVDKVLLNVSQCFGRLLPLSLGHCGHHPISILVCCGHGHQQRPQA